MKALTLEQVLEEFANECKILRYWVPALPSDRWGRADIAWAAWRWLAERDMTVQGQYRFTRAGDTAAILIVRWPNDPLRLLLEEVRGQLKDNEEA